MNADALKRKLAIILNAVVRGERAQLTGDTQERTIAAIPELNLHYKERFEAQRRLACQVAGSLEVNEILERVREEAKALIPSAMEVCILLLDPEAPHYTRPLQCALYEGPMNCISCKRNRPAIQRAIASGKAVIVHESDPIVRPDESLVEIGPEMAIPVFLGDEVVAIVSVVSEPGGRFSLKDSLLIKDLAENIGQIIVRSKRYREVTQEKIRVSQILSHLSHFAPLSVRKLVEQNPELTSLEKEKKDVTVLFLDLEDYTKLSASKPEAEVNSMIVSLFSSFVDPIHRSHGDIVETAGDGLMIVFKDLDARTNAINAVNAAFDIYEVTRRLGEKVGGGLESMTVNMGINSGKALVGFTQFKGSLATRATYTATGPVTNVAARLAAYAQGGDILIGEETKKLIADIWSVSDRGLTQLKGIAQAVKVYSLVKGSCLYLLSEQSRASKSAFD